MLLSACQATFHSSTSSSNSRAVDIVTTSELQATPDSTGNSDRRLTNSQRESLAIFRRFNISQPQLQGQVILAKVLRSTEHQVLVDPGYYGLNWVSKQVRVVTSSSLMACVVQAGGRVHCGCSSYELAAAGRSGMLHLPFA
jgi:hypothetical protein